MVRANPKGNGLSRGIMDGVIRRPNAHQLSNRPIVSCSSPLRLVIDLLEQIGATREIWVPTEKQLVLARRAKANFVSRPWNG